MTGERQIELLTQMGIDVWVRRGSVSSDSTTDPALELPLETPAPSRSQPSSVPVVDAPASPPAHTHARTWTAFAAGAVVLVGEVTLPQDRRFAHDLVLAAAGYPQEDTVAMVTFEEVSPGGQPSNAVLAFIRGQIDRRRAELLIVCGRVTIGLGTGATASHEDPHWTRLYGVRCLWVPDLDRVRTRPDWKRSLWRALIQSP